MTIDGESAITLDDAQQSLLALLDGGSRPADIGLNNGWATIENVQDAGASRFDRLVGFDLVMPDGTRKTFTATITEDENE